MNQNMLMDFEDAQKAPLYYAAAYARASKDDSESSTIANQIGLIKDYIKADSEISIVYEYSDSGFSGVDFQRPSFVEMMKSIESGKINCVIVKDAYVKHKLKNISVI